MEGWREEEGGTIWWWILQLLIVMPFPMILVSHVGVLMVGAVSQTLTDGSTPIIGKDSLSRMHSFLHMPGEY